ncbi:MAG: hypothetical protein IJ150_11700 [Bacteroidales bacterium]|nr:hypothetical protein [Bacteroidales bacterium]
MVEFDFIKAILTDNQKINLHFSNKIILSETQEDINGRNNIVQRITIDEDDIDEIEVYKLADENGEIDFSFFKNGTQTPKLLRKFCDYIILCTYKKEFFVVLVELKTSDKNNLTDNFKNAKKQLDAGEVFIKYILSTFDRIKNDGDNKKSFKDIAKCELDPNRCIKKCVFLSNINQTASMNRQKTISAKKIHSDGYYRCDLSVTDTFQLKSILQKK